VLVVPGLGSEFRESLDREVGDSGKERSPIIAYRELQPTTAFHHRKDRRNLRPCLWAADVDPIPPSDGDSPDILPMSVGN
jgi:hypothetical protein